MPQFGIHYLNIPQNNATNCQDLCPYQLIYVTNNLVGFAFKPNTNSIAFKTPSDCIEDHINEQAIRSTYVFFEEHKISEEQCDVINQFDKVGN